MRSQDLLAKVRTIEIKSRGLTNQIFSGQYHSAFKGKGMAFSEVREYQFGDDIRSIDWNVTARLNHPYVKIFEEERELTVILLIDVSGSNEFGTNMQLKEEMMTEIAAVLSFSAIQNNDKVGVIFFSDKIEKFIPPKKGKTHILRIIRELITFKPESKQTNISEALRYLTNVIKKRCTAFIISDFQDNDYEKAVGIANKKHDIIAIDIFDEKEKSLSGLGLMRIKDAESGEMQWVNTNSKSFVKAQDDWFRKMDKYKKLLMLKHGVDMISLSTGKDYIKGLIRLFKMREGRY
jgi:uncharacterized protein (DUF58 family)